MNPCKHGHIDGALHAPCYQCRSEYAKKHIELLYFLHKAKEAKMEQRVVSEQGASDAS